VVIGSRYGTARLSWLGHRRVDCARHPHPEQVRPVRVRTGVSGERQPHRTCSCRTTDPGDVANFARGDGPVVPYPDFALRAWEAHGCGRLVVAGAELAAIRQRLDVRAAAEALAA
jgi:hypothetical protein